MTATRTIFHLGATAVLAGAVWTGTALPIGGGRTNAAEANTATPGSAPVATVKPPAIAVVPAETREVVETVMVAGSLLPREEVVVGVDIDGLRILDLGADVADRVTAGQVVARLADDTIRTQLAQNASNIARADAAIAQARSNIANAEAAEVEASAALERAKPLRERGIISQEVFEQRTSAARGAAARLEAARAALDVAHADRAVLVAAGREIELRLGKTEIKAPTAGIVLARSARIGAVAGGSGEPLFRIARDGKIELEADVPEGQISKLRLGQPVDVTPAGFNAPIRGEIRLLSPQIDTTTRLGRVRVALPADAAVRSGSFARGTIETARRSGVSVPRSAVMTERGHATVQAVKDGRIETRKVEVGLSGDGRVLILSGIEAGEQVVVKAGTFVRHGDQVTPVVAKAEEIGG
ncbi:efflux RND transporter periplasmic adaptor subunit [Prosthecomicrobium hirschii]|uniref:efflux RND transporter periplasmic adaptor subunit n=1 Tax=Prosthecodimorpha hirschii TaxID=665126 RepID=UPI002220CF0E|nr:efflux RND transporter periplasmic adaptor subunit [Prosthecomicrobium hirschii]MCW1839490.1 efflux RND transporter periplasmic adaptor subunit [Prosthecomicrobium hirschii]